MGEPIVRGGTRRRGVRGGRAVGARLLAVALVVVAGAAHADATIPVAQGGGLVLHAACPETPERALLSGYPVPMPAAPRARLFRYRLDGGAPAVGTVEPHPDGVALRFPGGAWLNADTVAVVLPVAWQRLRFAPVAGAARACGVAVPQDGKRARFAAIQTALAARGLDPGRTDGVFDPATGAAIAAYQSYFGLVVDGAPTPALRRHLAANPTPALDLPTLRALAALVEGHWRPPGWARGAWGLTVPVRLRLAGDGTVLAATALAAGAPRLDRVADTAAHAALAAGRLAGAAGLPRDLVLHLTLPVGAAHRAYARRMAARLAGHRAFAGLPPAAAGGRVATMRLHIDGAARTIRSEVLDAGTLTPAALARARAAIARLPRILPPPAEGGPNVFAMDITLFARAPHVLPGRVAWSDWPAPDMGGDEE